MNPGKEALVWVAVILAAAAAGLAIGWLQRRHLNTLRYRQPGEHELATPGPRRWVLWISTAVCASLAARGLLDPSRIPVLIPTLPLALTGPWLAAADLDVMRLPNRVTAPAAVLTGATVVGVAATPNSWTGAMTAGIAALIIGGPFAALALLNAGGGLGGGDVKLAAIIALALGAHNLITPVFAITIGSIGAIVWVKATRRQGPFPYGPALLAGAWAAALLA